ncbi:hypothetical protein [Kitasatospora sp. NPDC059327]|uniref:hypothetical protein n=1 Tax=Kitasatospora sp. NPDC059327 TaxID=3346803 RepID=UPI0036C79A41
MPSKSAFVYPERPDFPSIRQEAAAAVARELGPIAHPIERARRAVEILTQAEADITTYKPLRDRAALSLWAYEGHRTRGLEQSIGCTRMQWTRIQASAFGWKSAGGNVPPPTPAAGPDRVKAARAAGIVEQPVDEALRDIAKFGILTEQAIARQTEARKARDAAIVALRQPPYLMSHEAIAAQTGAASEATVVLAAKRRTDEKTQADLDQVRQEAVDQVAAELLPLTDPTARAHRAEQIANAANGEITEYTRLRDRAALSLWAYAPGRIRHMTKVGYTREAWGRVWTAALGQPLPEDQEADKPPVAGPARARIAHEHGIAELPVEDALADVQKYRLLIEHARTRQAEAQRIHDETAGGTV